MVRFVTHLRQTKLGCYVTKPKPTKAWYVYDHEASEGLTWGKYDGWLRNDQSTAGYSGWQHEQHDDQDWHVSGKHEQHDDQHWPVSGNHEQHDDRHWHVSGNDEQQDDHHWHVSCKDPKWLEEEEHPGGRKSGWGDDEQQGQDDDSWGSWNHSGWHQHAFDHKPRPPNHPPPQQRAKPRLQPSAKPVAAHRQRRNISKQKPAAKTMPITIMSKETREKLAETAAALEPDQGCLRMCMRRCP